MPEHSSSSLQLSTRVLVHNLFGSGCVSTTIQTLPAGPKPKWWMVGLRRAGVEGSQFYPRPSEENNSGLPQECATGLRYSPRMPGASLEDIQPRLAPPDPSPVNSSRHVLAFAMEHEKRARSRVGRETCRAGARVGISINTLMDCRPGPAVC